MTEPRLVASTRKSGEDLLVGLCGFVTSLLTALILWWVEAHFEFAFYTWTFWFVIPVGALLSGFGGASGYFAGSWFFGHRPTRLLLLNIIIASVATFFLIHYLSYITLQVQGKQVSDYISFSQYLDITIRSTSMGFYLRTAKVGSTGELGALGYGVALLQIIGFAVGGFAVYGHLLSKPYCERCSRYLSGKGKQIRYTGDAEGLQATTALVLGDIASDAIASAIEHHKAFGNPSHKKKDHLRSVFEVRHCKECRQHWVKFSIEKQSGNDWKEIPQLTVARFSDQVVNISK